MKIITLLSLIALFSGCACTKRWWNSVDEDTLLRNRHNYNAHEFLFSPYSNSESVLLELEWHKLEEERIARAESMIAPPRKYHRNDKFWWTKGLYK